MRIILSIMELITKPPEVLMDTDFELLGGLSIRRFELLGGFV